MADTPNRAYPYPGGTAAPNGPYAFQSLADAIDADVQSIVDAAAVVSPFGHLGKTNGFQALGAEGATISMNAAQILRGGMTFDDFNDALVVPAGWAGVYRLTFHGYVSGGSGYVHQTRAIKNGSLTPILGGDVRVWKADAADIAAGGGVLVELAAGDTVALYGANGSAWGTTGFDGTFLELEYKGA